MSSTFKKRLSIAISLAVTAGFLVLAARNVQFAELREVLWRARWRWTLAMGAVSLADLAIRAARWRILLSAARPGPSWPLLRLEAIGIAVNNVLFLRLGELARAALAARELGLGLATVLASVVIERALDVAALLTLFNLCGVWLPGLVSPQTRLVAAAALGGAVLALLLLVAAESLLKPGGAWEKRLKAWPRIHGLVAELVLGAAVLRRPANAAAAAALSLLLWLVDAASYWAAAFALGLEGLIDYPRSILILSWGGAGSALPAAPGAIGTFEAMVKTIVAEMGAGEASAFGYAVFSHTIMYAVVTAIGLFFLYRVGLSVGGLERFVKENRG